MRTQAARTQAHATAADLRVPDRAARARPQASSSVPTYGSLLDRLDASEIHAGYDSIGAAPVRDEPLAKPGASLRGRTPARGGLRVASARDHGTQPLAAPMRARVGPAAPMRLEAQADWFADSVIAGRRGAAWHLARGPPARRPVLHHSPGEPLADVLRRNLETRCDVALSTVRIHYDGAAARLARHRGAQAFTAGNHIYFGLGAYRPHTSAGLHLLLHELAHVVQQVGDGSTSARVALAPRCGTASPQHRDVLSMKAPTPAAVVDFYLARFVGQTSLRKEVERWRDDVALGNEPWATTDTTLKDLLERRRKAIAAKDATATAAVERDATALNSSLPDPQIRSFYVDYLKASGKPTEASRWLRGWNKTGTMYLDRAALAAVAAGTGGSVANMALELWRNSTLFADARPEKLAALLRGFFLGPGRDNPGLKADGKWFYQHPRIGKGIADIREPLPATHSPTDDLLDNELHWGLVQAIYDADNFRILLVEQIDAWTTKSGKTPLPAATRTWVESVLVPWRADFGLDDPASTNLATRPARRYAAVVAFLNVLESAGLSTAPGLSREGAELLAAIAPQLWREIVPAATIWQAVLRIDVEKALVWESVGEAIEYLDPATNTKVTLPFTTRDVVMLLRAGDTKYLKDFRKYLTHGLAPRVFARPRGKLPSIADYASIVRREKTALRDAAYNAFEAPNTYLVASNPDLLEKPKVMKDIIANSVMLQIADVWRDLLAAYDADADMEKATTARNEAAAKLLAADPKSFVEPSMPGIAAVTPFVQRERAGDRRLAHRFRIADALVHFSNQLGWSDLGIAALLLRAEHAKQKTIDLALISDWEWEPNADLALILGDFPRGARSYSSAGTTVRTHDAIRELAPVSMRHIFRVFEDLQHVAETQKIREIVARARKTPDVPKVAILIEAERWMLANFVRPQRAVVQEAYWETNDRTRAGWMDALLDHPKTQDFMAKRFSGPGADFVVPEYPPGEPPAVMWAVPAFAATVAALRSDVELSGWVYDTHFPAAGAAAPMSTNADVIAIQAKGLTRSAFDDPAIVSDELWRRLAVDALDHHTDAKTGVAQVPHDILGRVEDRQYQKSNASFVELKLAQREATSIERNTRTKRLIEALELYQTGLKGLDRVDVPGVGKMFKSDLDALVYREVAEFEKAVRPSEDRLAHRAAWMFELMDADEDTRKKLRNSDSAFVVRQYSWWSALALEYVDNATKRELLLSVIADRDGRGVSFFTPDPAKDAVATAKDRRAARSAYVDRQAKRVRELDDGFAKTIQKWRSTRGMWARAGTSDTDLGSLGGVGVGGEFKEGQEFKWNGTWKVLSIFRPFTYHPSVVGEGLDLDPTNPRRYRGLSVVVVDGAVYTSAQRESDKHTPIKLLTIGRGSSTKVITTADELWLAEMSHAVTMRLIHDGPAAFLDALAEIGNLVLEVVEFIPGIGQGVAVARTAWQIVDFITNGEFVDLMAALTEDPIARIEEAVTDWTERLKWENLVLFLLLGPSAGPNKFARPNKKEPRGVTRTGSGRVRRLAHSLVNMGLGLYDAVSSVRTRIQEKVFALQLELAERPVLHRLLLLIAERYSLLETIGRSLFSDLENFEPAKVGADLSARMQGIVDRIAGFQIPTSIMTVEAFVGVILEFIISRLKGKKGAAVKLVVEGLKAIDQWKHVEHAIAMPFKGLEPTLNAGWRKVVALFETPMEKGRRELIEMCNAAFSGLSGLPGFSAKLEMPKEGLVQSTEVDEDGDDVPVELPDADLDDADAVDLFKGPVPMPKLGSGRPIPGDIKPEIEGAMFQHFSDVRLHVSDSGTKFLESLGAKGAAIDSHVVLHEDLQLSSGPGKDVLLHELGHVVQNRDAPKSGPPPPSPGPLPIAVGIRNDPGLEDHADAVVDLAKRQGKTAPLRIAARRSGMRLDTGIVPRFFAALGSDENVREFRESVDEDVKKVGVLGASTRKAIEHVLSSIKTMLGGSFAANKPFAVDRPLVRGHILGNPEVEKDLDAAIHYIAYRVQKPQDPTSKREPKAMWLDASLFMTELRRYIFGRTGVLVDAKEKALTVSVKRGKSTKKLDTLDPTTPIKSLAVQFIDLGLVNAGSALYKKIFEDSFGSKMKDKLGKSVPMDADYRRALRVQIASYARSADGPGMFLSSKMALKASVVKTIRERMEAAEAAKAETVLPADAIPKWADYVKTEKGDVHPAHGSIGLRVSTYGTKEDKGTVDAQSGTERESHHLTQFLFAEYFAHGTDSKQSPADKCAFKHLRADKDAPLYPFVDPEGGMPKTIKNDTLDIPIASLAAKRGGKMPALLLARSTHRSGGLHVSSFAEDFGVTASTQSEAVDGEYRRALRKQHADFATAEEGTKKGFTEYMTKGGGSKPAEQTKIRTAVHAAILHTYRWMRKHMHDRLLPALLDHERAYYQTMAKAHETPGTTDADLAFVHDDTKVAKTAGFSVSRDTMAKDLRDVATAAKSKNDTGLEAFGLFAK